MEKKIKIKKIWTMINRCRLCLWSFGRCLPKTKGRINGDFEVRDL